MCIKLVEGESCVSNVPDKRWEKLNYYREKNDITFRFGKWPELCYEKEISTTIICKENKEYSSSIINSYTSPSAFDLNLIHHCIFALSKSEQEKLPSTQGVHQDLSKFIWSFCIRDYAERNIDEIITDSYFKFVKFHQWYTLMGFSTKRPCQPQCLSIHLSETSLHTTTICSAQLIRWDLQRRVRSPYMSGTVALLLLLVLVLMCMLLRST